MRVIKKIRDMRRTALDLRMRGKSIGFVPTMGALHAGHVSLIAKARLENDIVAVSIFVNPGQFGPGEDYLKYPRPLKEDVVICREAGADLVFTPQADDLYPENYLTHVEVGYLSDILCGAFRPGHFRGVTTIVSKFLNIIQPSRVYLGEKDFQQLLIIRRMVSDLNMPVKVISCPIIRETSGLALSSRNRYLGVIELKNAKIISESLKDAGEYLLKNTKANPGIIRSRIYSKIRRIPGAKIDYIEICRAETLKPLKKMQFPAVILAAVWIGRTRLIDNFLLRKPQS